MVTTAQPLMAAGTSFARGATPTPRHKLLAAEPFLAPEFPPQWALVPKQLSYWGNNQYGDCVTAEEAFKCACDNPENFITDQVVESWASKHGVLNGADLGQVMDFMQKDGFVQGQNTYNDGPYKGVDFSNEAVLQAAIFTGVVKIGIDANALPSGAGNSQGWYSLGGRNQYRNEDHCVALCGYGSAGWLFQQLGVPLPATLSANQPGYLLFTWSTIGFVDHAWIMSTVGEAWVRSPSTVIVGPEPQPTPPSPPTPTPGPVAPTWWQEFIAWIESIIAHFERNVALVPTPRAMVIPWSEVLVAIQLLLKELGPTAIPMIEAWLATLPIPPFVLRLLELFLDQYAKANHLPPFDTVAVLRVSCPME